MLLRQSPVRRAAASTVTISGSKFSGASAVEFGSQAASSFTVNSATQITAVSPAETAGIVDVTVTTPSGTSPTSPADEFTYEVSPVVSSLSPSAGPLSGGTTVVVTGSGLAGSVGVSFGSTVASSYTVNSATQITATSPPAVAGPVDVTVTTPSGTSGTSAADFFTYEAAPLVSAVSPVAGPLAGSSTVTITGTGLTGATAVSFGATAATSYTVVSPTEIQAVSPAGPVGVVDLTVTTPAGTSAISSADTFTYELAPTVTAISPAVGPLGGGTTIAITGTGFTGASVVEFGSSSAEAYTVNSATSITAISPLLAAGSVDITVTTPAGSSATSASDKFSSEAAPTVTAIAPVAGPLGGGTTVAISGTNFTGASAVSFGDLAATSFVVTSATQLSATSPASAPGTVDVTVTSSSGTSSTSAADRFSYESAPAVVSLSPVAGLPAGGSTVTIVGTGFTGASVLSFGTASASYAVNSATSITATSPVHLAGTVDVAVTTPAGTSATGPADHFTYEAVPTLGAISPVAGLLTGGTAVTITGTGFTGASAVSFGTTPASSYSVVSGTEITVASPASVLGSVDVTVTTPVGTSATSALDVFSYEHAPIVSSVSPLAGPPSGSSLVTITGSGFSGASAVDFGDLSATSYTVDSAAQITATSPGESAGTVDVIVTTPVGTSVASSGDKFIYEAAPAVLAVSPSAGVPGGGTAVTVTGTGFSAASAVSFGSVVATSFTVNSATQITVSSPAGSLGSADVTVTTPVGTSATTASDEFTYEAGPSVGVVSPAAGLPAGGTSVTLTGSNFAQASAVSFGTSAASSFTVVSPTEIIATSPSGTAGSVDVTVTTPVATSAISNLDHFTYEQAPNITAVAPLAGLPGGGTSVTITGTGFSQASAVDFGTTAVGFSVNSSTSITATSPAGTGTVEISVTTPAGTSATSIADEFTYEQAPVVSLVSPVSGPTAGGTVVTVTGGNFTGASAVSFGSVTSGAYTVVSSTQITATSPAQIAGTADVTVTTPVATSSTSSADQFAYQATPSVSALSPVAGPPAGGTSVSVTGTNFTGASGVNFGAVAATSFAVNSSTSITAVSPAGSLGDVDVTVTTGTGTSATSSADKFIYETAPSVATVSPLAGLPAGGTTVNLSGTNFTGTTAVSFGAVATTSFTVNSATSITTTSPVHAVGGVDITVVTNNGTSAISLADEFTYEAAPVVSGLSPVAGLPAGASTVTVSGSGFTDATGVSFGSTAAASFTVDSATQITATSPPEPAGSVDVTVTTPLGTSATGPADKFAYEAPPSVSSLSPFAGLPAGGSSVIITGTGLLGTSSVNFGAVAAIYTVNSATQITATSPSQSAGAVDVTITTPVGTSAITAADLFTYEAVPTVTSLSPAVGLSLGGTSVTVSGTGFLSASAVQFGTLSATSFIVVSPTSIIATTPAAAAGIVDVTVTTPTGTSTATSSDQFAYEAAPSVSAISPSVGLPAGGNSVTITGSGFSGASAVDFGSLPATSFAVSSPTSITATAPQQAAGSVDVTVATPVGTSATSGADQYSYESGPVVTSLSPLAGLTTGGTTVSISGTGFVATSAVLFGAVAASSYTVLSSSHLTAVAPSGAPATVDITVTTPLGTSATSSADHYSYESAPSVTSHQPGRGCPFGRQQCHHHRHRL